MIAINIRRSSVVPPSPKLVRPGTESPTSPKLTKSHGHFSEEKKEEKKPREWSFANTLIRDVVYNSMLYSQKKDYHRILAVSIFEFFVLFVVVKLLFFVFL